MQIADRRRHPLQLRLNHKVAAIVCVVVVVLWVAAPGNPAPPQSTSVVTEGEPTVTPISKAPSATLGSVKNKVKLVSKAYPLVETECSSDHVTVVSNVQLSSDALNDIAANRPYPKGRGDACSKTRFLVVNTHTYGRHHNQLQEIINTVVWAHKLNRTAVIPWFRYDHQWIDPRTFYDFNELRNRYCLIYHDELPSAVQIASGKSGPLTTRCLGQGFADLPLKRMLGKLVYPCRKGSLTIPSHYTTRFGFNTTQAFINDHVAPATEGLLVVSGQVGFFMRPGLLEVAAAFKWLLPSQQVKAALKEQQQRLFSSSRLSLGVHSRSREKECFKEQQFDKEDGGEWLANLTDYHWDALATQCKLTTTHMDTILHSMCLVDSSTPHIILASDGQNPSFEAALVEKGALRTAPIPGLLGLAVDYFILSQCNLFTGNQLSSITQNVCYRRLGNGLSCNGVITEYLRYHARPILMPSSPDRAGDNSNEVIAD